MIHFDFRMSDNDAEKLLAAISETALRNDEYISNLQYGVYTGEITPAEANPKIEWHAKNKEYLLGLLARMDNTWVES